MRRALIPLLLLAAFAAPAVAQRTVVSPAPEAVSVTVYRDPNRARGDEMETDWLNGFALITETRTLTLPAGDSVIRFEGVAGGMIPVSAIVTGLPGGVAEKNRDARLLSPGTLVDAALGRRVHIRRTSRATGRVTETEAIIRSGPDGVVLQTPEGVEALRCTGMPETLVYDSVPEGLSDRPTLAVSTTSTAPATVTARLSYLATGFDWEADYVAQVAEDRRTLDLFAWLTLANGNDESFADASTQAVAGELNRSQSGADFGARPVSSQIMLQCWPQGSTSDIPLMMPPAAPDLEAYDMHGEEIVVTGSRISNPNLLSSSPVSAISAEQEELGDLKLYRIPIPVTVAANAQKQVALMNRSAIPFQRLYGSALAARNTLAEPQPTQILIRMKNVAARGLGLPLPAGSVAVFEPVGGRPMLAGETRVRDTAIGEDVELLVGESPEVQVMQRERPKRRKAGKEKEEAESQDDGRPRDYEVEISNARPDPVTVELLLYVYDGETLVRPSRRLGTKNGRRLWIARVPANGRTMLAYRVKPASMSGDEGDGAGGDEDDGDEAD